MRLLFRPGARAMMDSMRSSLALTAILLLAACGQADNEPGPGGVTVGEARALDEAAEMIEQRRMPAEALGVAPDAPAASPAAPASQTPAPAK